METEEFALVVERPEQNPAAKKEIIPLPDENKPENTNKQKEPAIIHIVVKGDTLWGIAKRYLRNPFKYRDLAEISKIKDPNLIFPGDRVTIIKKTSRP